MRIALVVTTALVHTASGATECSCITDSNGACIRHAKCSIATDPSGTGTIFDLEKMSGFCAQLEADANGGASAGEPTRAPKTTEDYMKTHECCIRACSVTSGCTFAQHTLTGTNAHVCRHFTTNTCPIETDEWNTNVIFKCGPYPTISPTASPLPATQQHEESRSNSQGWQFTDPPTIGFFGGGGAATCMPWQDCWTPAPSASPTPGAQPANAAGDPFTTYNGKKSQFWVIPGKPVALLKCGPWELSASVFETGSGNQWFKDLQLFRGPRRVLNVSVAPTVRHLNQSHFASPTSRAGPATVLVQAEEWQISGVGESQLLQGGGSGAGRIAAGASREQKVAAALRNVRGMSGPPYEIRAAVTGNAKHNGFHTATVTCGEEAGATLGFEVSSAPAVKMNALKEKVAFAHLDLGFLPTFDAHASRCTGVLPEIWGLLPLSETTSKMLVPPRGAKLDESADE